MGVPPATATKLQYHLRKAQISLLQKATISRTNSCISLSSPCGSCSVFEVSHIVYKYALSQLSLLLAMNKYFDKAQERAAFTSRSVLFVRDCLGKWLLRCNLPNSAVKLFFALFLNNLLTVIISAFGTYLVALDQFVALGALGETGCFEFPVCKTRIRFGFRHFIFRYCHLLTSDIFATFAYTAF